MRDRQRGDVVLDRALFCQMRAASHWPLLLNITTRELANVIAPRGRLARGDSGQAARATDADHPRARPAAEGQGGDSSGHLANTYAYDLNGNRTTQTGSAPAYWGFQGGYMVDDGLYHYGARYYNPAQAAWTQQDPLNQISDLTQADRYTFAGDNPINLVDPTGQSILGDVVKGLSIVETATYRI